MRKPQVLLLGAMVLAMGLGIPNQVQAADCVDPFDVYAEYAGGIISVTFRGTDAMDDVVDRATPRIRRLLNAGMHERARELAAEAIDRTESVDRAVESTSREFTVARRKVMRNVCVLTGTWRHWSYWDW